LCHLAGVSPCLASPHCSLLLFCDTLAPLYRQCAAILYPHDVQCHFSCAALHYTDVLFFLLFISFYLQDLPLTHFVLLHTTMSPLPACSSRDRRWHNVGVARAEAAATTSLSSTPLVVHADAAGLIPVLSGVDGASCDAADAPIRDGAHWPHFAAGAVAGFVDTLVSHPIDTYKVRARAHTMKTKL
jgi:hypothetical protein